MRRNPASHKGQEGHPLPLTVTEEEAFCLKEEGQARRPPTTINNGDGGGGMGRDECTLCTHPPPRDNRSPIPHPFLSVLSQGLMGWELIFGVSKELR